MPLLPTAHASSSDRQEGMRRSAAHAACPEPFGTPASLALRLACVLDPPCRCRHLPIKPSLPTRQSATRSRCRSRAPPLEESHMDIIKPQLPHNHLTLSLLPFTQTQTHTGGAPSRRVAASPAAPTQLQQQPYRFLPPFLHLHLPALLLLSFPLR